jgi:hypothetical protein
MSVDYSEAAVTQRIRQVSQLRKLCLSLGRAKPIVKEQPVQPPATPATAK